MIMRIHLRACSITVPEFPDRSRSPFYHISPTRVIFLSSNSICDIYTSPFCEFTHQPLSTDNTRTDMQFICNCNAVYQVLENSFLIIFIYNTESQWQEIGCYRIITVLPCFRIIEFLIESCSYIFCKRYIFGDITFIARYNCKFL